MGVLVNCATAQSGTTSKYFIRLSAVTWTALAMVALPAIGHAKIEEIIVTATKREQSLQDVPLAISVFRTRDLELSGVRDIESLTSIAPSLTVQTSSSESLGSTFRLRGIGTTGNNAGLEGSVGVFLDGVYLSRPGIAFQEFVDIDQIEVLRGPQGTLFGRNTSAGAISIKTKKPSFDSYEAQANATFSNYDGRVVSAGANLPLTDTFAIRGAGIFVQHDGFRKSLSGLESNDRDRYSLRGQALWRPTHKAELRLIADYMNAKNEACCDAMIKFERGAALGTPGGDPMPASPIGSPGFDTVLSNMALPAGTMLAGYTYGGLSGDGVTKVGDVGSRLTNVNRGADNPQEQWGLSAEFTYKFDFAKFTYLGAYRDYNSSASSDIDFTSLDLLYQKGSLNNIDTQSHEVRLDGEWGRLNWLVGGYYSREKIVASLRAAPGADYADYAQTFTNTIALGALAGAFTAGDGSSPSVFLPSYASLVTGPGVPTVGAAYPNNTYTSNDFLQKGTSWSLFTHNILELTDKLDLTLGLRYNAETKDGRFSQSGTPVPGCLNAAGTLAALRQGGGVFDRTTSPAGLASGTYANGKTMIDELYEAYIGLTCFPAFNGVAPAYDKKFKEDFLTGIASLSYSITDNIHTYASFSRGVKSGGFNLDPLANIADPSNPFESTSVAVGKKQDGNPTFKSEKVRSYEIGLKTSLFNDVLRTNIAVFYMDIKDIQILEFNGVQFIVENVSKAKSTGVEVETAYSPIDGLDLGASVAFADTRYPDEVANDGPDSIGAKVAGRPLTNAPKWVTTLSATLRKPIPDTSLAGFLHADWRYDSSKLTGTTPAGLRYDFTNTDDEILNGKKQGGAAKLNVRAGMGDADGQWGVEFWARNVFDKTTEQIVFGIPIRAGALGSFTDDPRTYGVTLRAKLN